MNILQSELGWFFPNLMITLINPPPAQWPFSLANLKTDFAFQYFPDLHPQSCFFFKIPLNQLAPNSFHIPDETIIIFNILAFLYLSFSSTIFINWKWQSLELSSPPSTPTSIILFLKIYYRHQEHKLNEASIIYPSSGCIKHMIFNLMHHINYWLKNKIFNH